MAKDTASWTASAVDGAVLMPNPAARMGEGTSLMSRGDDELAPSRPSPPMLLRVLTAAVLVLAEKSERRDRRERWRWRRPALLALVPSWLSSLSHACVADLLLPAADCLTRRDREDFIVRMLRRRRDLIDLMFDCPFAFILVMMARRSVLGLLGAPVLALPCSGSAQGAAGLIVVVVVAAVRVSARRISYVARNNQ